MFVYKNIGPIGYYYYDFWQIASDPRSNKYPLMDGGPWTILFIIGLYLYLVKCVGPRFMTDRKPYDLRKFIFVYNVILSLMNAFFFYHFAIYTNFGMKSWFCNPSDDLDSKSTNYMFPITWLFFMTKFIDLLDTMFFILRKKLTHVTFLHVYHHSMVPINFWLGFKYLPNEIAAFFPFLNSVIHIFMYAYYAVSLLGPEYRRYLWWKKFLTQAQIAQLTLFVINYIYITCILKCDMPKIVVFIWLPQAALLVLLFCAFFAKSYAQSNFNVAEKSNRD